MKWKKLFSGAGVLAVCAALAKLLGAFYRIPLTNIAGAEGIGLYQMVFPLYTVLLTISSGGLNSAISKVVASSMAKGDEKGATKILKVSLYSLLALSGAAAILLIVFRRQIANLQGNSMAQLAYLGIAPAVVFVAVICCLRGYFQGRGNMLPSGLSQIFEQLIKLFAGLFFASLLLPYGVEYAVLGAVLGVTLSEFCAMLILIAQYSITYLIRRKKSYVRVRRVSLGLEAASDFVAAPAVPELKNGEILKKLYRVAIPITLGSLIMPLTQLIDSVMVINVLTSAGMSSGEATSLFGLFSGPISSLINMPVAITLSISVALLPKIAFLCEKNSENKGEYWVDRQQNSADTDTNDEVTIQDKKCKNDCRGKAAADAFKFTMILSLPAATALIAFAPQIVAALYSRGLSGSQLQISADLLRVGSLSVIFIGVIQVATAVLQGADKPHRPAINLLYGAIAKVMLTLVLLPVLGIMGAAIASCVCYAVIALIDIIYMQKSVRVRLDKKKTFVIPLIGCAVFVAVTYFALMGFNLFVSFRPAFFAAALLGAAAYGGILILFKAVTIKEFLN